MTMPGMNEVQNGIKVMIEGEPSVIIDVDFVKPDKEPPRTHVRHRNIRTGRVTELILLASNEPEAVDVLDIELEFLHTAGDLLHFRHPKTHEQFFADKAAMANSAPWLIGNESYTVTLETGAVVRLPLFAARGERIRVDTRTGIYVARAR